MDTPEHSAPVPDDPTAPITPVPSVDPGPTGGHGHEPTVPIPLGPVGGSWSPPPPAMPPASEPTSFPTPGPAPTSPTWGPISTPYGLAWGPVPIPPPPSPPRRTLNLVALTAVVVVISMVLGVGVGYAVWRPAPSSTNVAANSGTGAGTGGSGTSGSPFGSGSTPTNPQSGSSGGPSVSSSVPSQVDPGLVDINVTLSYEQESAAGTGQVLTSNGEVLTNNHVIDGATSISATDIGNGQTYTASVVGYDKTGDIAVIQLHGASGLSTVSIGDSSKVTVGEPIVAIGNAGGKGGTPSVANGTVTTLNQSITASDDDGSNSEQLTGLIEVDANVQPGDSGGPLVDSAGQVVGIDTAASEDQLSAAGGDGYAIPINTAIAIAKEIEAGKSSSTVHVGATAFLGVVVQPADGSGLGGLSGAAIIEVAPGSPAAQAGLAVGDVITSADGQTVSDPQTLSTVISSQSPGDSISVTWVDVDGNQQTATVSLASGPAT
jgi:S1-C subfamily serine protease